MWGVIMCEIILNFIIYIFLTSILIFFLFASDRFINKNIEKYREPFLKKIYLKFNIKSKEIKKKIRVVFDWLQTIIIALFLVFIIQYFYLGNYTVPTSSMYPTITPGERFFADKVSYKFSLPERGEIIVFKEPFYDKQRYTKRLIGLPGEYIEIKENSVFINDKKYNNEISYYSRGTLIADKKWKVPQKGDLVKIEKGIFEIGGRRMNLESLKNILDEDRNIIDEIIIINAVFLLNDDIPTGPIYDRDILYQLIKENQVKLDENYYFTLGDNSMNSLDSRYWGFVSENRLIGKMMFRIWPLSRFGIVR